MEIQRRPENSDRVRLDARTRGIQTPDLEATSRVVASRFPTALSAVEKKKKKKRPIKLPRVHVPAFYPTTVSPLFAQGTKPELHQRYPFEI